ncbi:MAG: MFS transporter [Desulfobacteraceae bacterium]|nr:MFS transporter [Desulfobacteraceae bacterium]
MAISAATFGVLTALFSIVYGVLQLPVGMMLDRMSIRRLLTLSCALTAVGTAVYALSPNALMAGVGSTVLGAGTAVAFVGAMFLSRQWFPPSRFALIIGLTVMVGCVGGAIMQQVLAFLLREFSWRVIMMGLAAVAVIIAGLLWIMVRDTPEGSQPDSLDTSQEPSAGLSTALKMIVSNWQIWFAGIYCGLTLGHLLAFGSVWDIAFQTGYYSSLPKAALVNSSLFVGLGVGCTVIGWASDRLSRRVWPMRVTALVACMAMVGLIATPPLPDWAVVTIMLILGFACGGSNLSYALAVENSPPKVNATALGLVATVAFVLSGVLQILPGIALGAAGKVTYTIDQYRNAFILFPISSFIAFIFTFMIRETHCKSQAEM